MESSFQQQKLPVQMKVGYMLTAHVKVTQSNCATYGNYIYNILYPTSNLATSFFTAEGLLIWIRLVDRLLPNPKYKNLTGIASLFTLELTLLKDVENDIDSTKRCNFEIRPPCKLGRPWVSVKNFFIEIQLAQVQILSYKGSLTRM